MEHYTPGTWATGSDPVSTTEGKLAGGLILPGRTPLGQNKTTGQFHAWNPSGSDGTEIAVRLTAQAVDSSAGAVDVQLIKSGTFNPDLVIWPDGTTEVQKLCAFVGTAISLQMPG